jgi:pimeloyl-ACP methyl ester carboxylesterase
VLAFDRTGSGPPVVLLHGWPGDRTDYRLVTPLLTGSHDVVVPDLLGFGESDKPRDSAYDVHAQAVRVIDLAEGLALDRAVFAGYDIGSRIAQEVAKQRPDVAKALVISPPVPGVGRRVLEPDPHREFWYQHFHRLELAEELIDGRPDAVRAYLNHFWSHWSGPEFELSDEDLDHLVSAYSPPGAFTASIGWYRSGAGTIARALGEAAPEPTDRVSVPTTVLWPEHDPLFPREWSDRLGDFFADAELELVDGVGHFVPLEAPEAFARAVTDA